MIHQEQRSVSYDFDLQIEAYHLYGIVSKFPNHFHDYYVIGFIEGGKRHLWCKDKEYDLSEGDFILFNPRDNHYCSPLDQESFDYRAINIPISIMRQAVKDITGKEYVPHFTQNVVYQSDMTKSLSGLYDAIVYKATKLEKEEAFFFLLDQILQEYSIPYEDRDIASPNELIKMLCNYMEENFEKIITLDELLSMTNWSKSYLLRSFTKQIGVSPYRYLQTIRLGKAKKFLEHGISPLEVSDLAGFSDQSHFTHFFKEFIGLTPKQYQRIFMDTKKTSVIKEIHNE
jgi:AraC-like DNA-binding protein